MNLKTIKNTNELIHLLNENGKSISEKESELILGYYEGHGCEIRFDKNNNIYFAYDDEDDNECVKENMSCMIERVAIWNIELMEESECNDYIKDLKEDEKIIDRLYEYLY